MTPYQNRDQLLWGMGFGDYREYLQSELWSRIRGRAFKEHGSRCLLCGKRAALMHHRDYEYSTLVGDDLSSLVPLCNLCHQDVEFTKAGRKRSFKQVDSRLLSLFFRRSRSCSATSSKRLSVKSGSRKKRSRRGSGRRADAKRGSRS